MDKESLIEFQKIDSNCNDCIFMQRNLERFKESKELHFKWQLEEFERNKKKVIDKANWYRLKFNDLENWNSLLNVAEKMKFQFDIKEVSINYGNCTKLNKEVSFLPNTCQLDTQDCFKHRREDNEK